MDKKAYRRQLLAARRALTPVQWHQRSDRLCQTLLSCPPFARARHILAYCSTNNEPDLSSLFELPDRCWGLPRCEGKTLMWHWWQPGNPLESGAYGILEPAASAPTCSPAAVDLILVPAVACDRAGYRLGYGAGYYDRLLSRSDWARVPTLGITFACQAELPRDPWDVPLQGVCTDLGWLLSERH